MCPDPSGSEPRRPPTGTKARGGAPQKEGPPFGQADPLPRAHCAFHNCAWTPPDTRSEQTVEKARASHLLSAPHPTAAGPDSGRTHLLAAIEVLSRMRALPPGADQDPEAGVTADEDPEPGVTRGRRRRWQQHYISFKPRENDGRN